MSESTGDTSAARALTAAERAYVDAARTTAFILYEGVATPHRSCGIALAETFGLPTPAYQALRRGGITGAGACGAIRAGEQVLGELLGDPSPTGGVTPALRRAVTWYQAAWRARRFPAAAAEVDVDIRCNTLTRPHGEFAGPARAAFCTALAADVAELTAEALVRFGDAATRPAITPPPGPSPRTPAP